MSTNPSSLYLSVYSLLISIYVTKVEQSIQMSMYILVCISSFSTYFHHVQMITQTKINSTRVYYFLT